MLSGNLSPGEMKVVIYHVKRGMTEDFLEGEYVPAIEQIVDSECVTAKVCMQPMNTRPDRQPGKH